MNAPADIDLHRLPSHVGVIMDGNRRWARRQGLEAAKGHEEGLQAAKEAVRAAVTLGIPYLSFYTFSTENWRRSVAEVNILMGLVRRIREEFDFYRAWGVRIVHSGDVEKLPDDVQTDIRATVEYTSGFNTVVANMAINYGGRDEVLRAISRMRAAGQWDDPASLPAEERVKQYMDQPELPDIDLVIRTGDRYRLSNFFIWQAAYAELVFLPILWPDWKCDSFYEAVRMFQARPRTFGGNK